MKFFLMSLLLFLLAFAGLSAGLLLKRKGLRGSCRPETGHDCRCNPGATSDECDAATRKGAPKPGCCEQSDSDADL